MLKGVYKNLNILVGLICGCTVMMFGSIMYEGIKMLKNCEFNDRTMIIVSLLLSFLLPKKKQAN